MTKKEIAMHARDVYDKDLEEKVGSAEELLGQLRDAIDEVEMFLERQDAQAAGKVANELFGKYWKELKICLKQLEELACGY